MVKCAIVLAPLPVSIFAGAIVRPDGNGPDNRAAMDRAHGAGDSIKARPAVRRHAKRHAGRIAKGRQRSEEHTSELQSLMRISYAVFCLKKKNQKRIIIKS